MTECSICFQKITNEFTSLSCQCSNGYHSKCIDKWLTINTSCPTCRYLWNKNTKFSKQHNTERLIELNRRLSLEFLGITST